MSLIGFLYVLGCSHSPLMNDSLKGIKIAKWHSSKALRTPSSEATQVKKDATKEELVSEKRFKFSPYLHIPKGSQFSKAKEAASKQWCKALVDKNPKGQDYYQIGSKVAISGPASDFDIGGNTFWGGFVGGPSSASWQKSGSDDPSHELSMRTYSARTGVLIVRIPYNLSKNLFAEIRIQMDPETNNMLFFSYEVRHGPRNQKFENMSVQARFTCASNLLSMSF